MFALVAHNDRKRAWRDTANRSLLTHSRHRAGAGLYVQSCYDFASSYLLLPSRGRNSKADKHSSRRLVFRLPPQLLPLRHNMRVDGLSG